MRFSYGGILSAYMRMKYPNLVTGALSSSAPLYWATGHGDRHGFWKSVTEIFGSHSAACVDRVREGFKETARWCWLCFVSACDAGGRGSDAHVCSAWAMCFCFNAHFLWTGSVVRCFKHGATKSGYTEFDSRLGSIECWKMVLAACTASYLTQTGGCMKRFTVSDDIDDIH